MSRTFPEAKPRTGGNFYRHLGSGHGYIARYHNGEAEGTSTWERVAGIDLHSRGYITGVHRAA